MNQLIVKSRFFPRNYQIPILKKLNEGVKKVVWVCHRRGGKDITIFNWCIGKLLSETCTCFYILPTYSQAKKVIWDAINIDGFRILDYIPKEFIASMNSQEMKIRLINGSLFQLIGSDNIDSLMGTNPKIVVFSEYAMQNPAAWEYIKPIITVNKGHAIFISTPRGKNHFWELMRTAKTTEGWYCQINTINDTNVLTEEDMKKERDDGVSEEHIQQEYYCSFERGIEGSYYSSLINKMRDQNRIMPLCYDPHKLVNTSWDLGWNDFTGIIFFQMHGSQIHIFDFLEYGTTTFALIKDILDKKGYRYGIHLFPHDVENVDGQGTGCTRKEILENLKIPVTNVPRHLVHEGIEAVKVLLSSRIYIDNKKCERLISCLEYYHREWNEKHKVYGNKPIHDWSSHLSDAMRYLAMGLNLLEESNSDNEKALQNYFR